jgi:hypothetical protein
MPIRQLSFDKFKFIFKKKKTNEMYDSWNNLSHDLNNNLLQDLNNNNPWIGEPLELNQEEIMDKQDESIQENEDNEENQNYDENQHVQKQDNFIYILLLLLFIIVIPIFTLRIVILLFYLCVYKDLFKIKLMILRLNREECIKMEIDPFKLLFSQATVNTKFQNGILIKDTIDKLVTGEITPEIIEHIKVCILENRLHTLDNRRLHCFQEAVRRGAKFKTIPITIVMKNGYYESNIEWKMKGSKIVIKNNDWVKVMVTSLSAPGYYPEIE